MSDKTRAFWEWDAGHLGYLEDDPKWPGNGRGMEAYYQDMGILSSERERAIALQEATIDPMTFDDPVPEEEDQC